MSATDVDGSGIANLNPFRYRGYVYDTETGLYYLQSRYYDPELGRFISSDVYLSTGQGIIGHNAFAYCGNNPVSREDTEGKFWNTLAGALAGGLIGGIKNAIEGKNFWEGAAQGAISGAISGACVDLTVFTGGVASVALVAGGGAVSGIVSTWFEKGEDATFGDYVGAAIEGGATNLLAGYGGDSVFKE